MRKDILKKALLTKNGHIGASLSVVEILISIYENILTDDDVFILSKGHGCLALYSILEELGYHPDINKGHPDIDQENGIYCSTGSLGHGLPVAVGVAFAKKLKNEMGHVYVLISDGECQEGTTWESLQFASHHCLDNLTIIIDYNKLQALGRIDDIISLDNNFYGGALSSKIHAFGGYVLECEGHSIKNLTICLEIPLNTPKVIIANTIKGKGVSFMEDVPKWHNCLPSSKELEQAYEELDA